MAPCTRLHQVLGPLLRERPECFPGRGVRSVAVTDLLPESYVWADHRVDGE
ncbi:hypothetical protein ACFY3N_22340 [Streptomyces sp. NPDC000348]|uniref:hypothetical protein n=1 Tax=Streptomyces sp. NPDC000348 TaxID=3364538 RepID=UPI003678A2F7